MLQLEIQLIFIPDRCYTTMFFFYFPADQEYQLRAPTVIIQFLKISYSAHANP